MIPKEWHLRLATSPHNHTHVHAHVIPIHWHLHTYEHTHTESRPNPHSSLLICPFRHYPLCLFLFKRLDQEPPTTGLGSPVYHRAAAAPGPHSSNILVFILHNGSPRQSASPRRRENNLFRLSVTHNTLSLVRGWGWFSATPFNCPSQALQEHSCFFIFLISRLLRLH